jgi:glycine/D-amino acid oxidase-like deaminating enzyme
MHSIWEQSSWFEADVVIVGGGLIGISTAIEYLAHSTGKTVLVLERGVVPTGASTRNAGFACFGSVSEIASDIDLIGTDAARELVHQRVEGLARLRSRCKGAGIGYVDEGGHEIFLHDHPAIGRIEEVNSCIESIFGPAAFVDRTPLAAQYGLSSTVTTLIRTPYEATIDSGKLVRTLWGIAAQHGAHIRTGAEVLHIEDYADGVQIDVRTLTGNVRVKANNVVVASNAWIPNLVTSNQLPEILPGRGQVLVTKPLQNLHLRGSFHYDEGYYYFRRLGDRVLLGGGRNMDFAGEQTTSHETTTIIQEALEDLLRTVIVPHHNNVEIEYRWAGTMAFTSTKQPFVERVLPHTVVAFGCNGMGVALSSSIAMRAASILD